MAKKVLMIFLSVMLIASLTLISCSQDQKKPGPAPQPLEPVENEDGEHSENLAEGCDFESGDDYIIKGDGSEIAVVEGVGIDGSHATKMHEKAISEINIKIKLTFFAISGLLFTLKL